MSYDRLEHLVDHRRQNTLVVIGTELAEDRRKCIDTWTRKHTASERNHLQILGTGKRSNAARLGSNVVVDWLFEPRDHEMIPSLKMVSLIPDKREYLIAR